jgi:hypothetical protein
MPAIWKTASGLAALPAKAVLDITAIRTIETVPAIKAPKKLIEVALPLDAINVAAAREKSIRHGPGGHPNSPTRGHPKLLHLNAHSGA